MSVWRRFNNHGYPSLITTNIEHRHALLGSPDAAGRLLNVIGEVRHETRFQLLAFVIMPDHVHLVVAVPERLRLSRLMRLIKGRFANRHNRSMRSSGSLWQERYHERGLRSERELVAAIEYVHANPVKAGLVSQAESFPWSSANSAYDTDLDAFLG